METSAKTTPVVVTPTGRVLKQLSTSDMNISTRQDKVDCKGLIKRMSSEKKKFIKNATVTTTTMAESACSGTYSMLFPPGPMGLHLEPIHAEMGAQVKGYHFSNSYSGINCVVIKAKVKKGDVITLIDNTDVTQMSFKKVYNLLVSKMSSNKFVTFHKAEKTVDIGPNLHLNNEVNPVSPPESNVGTIDMPSPQYPQKHVITATTTTAALKSLFPVRYDEFSHVLSSVGAHIASLGGALGTNLEQGMVSVGASFEDKTVQVLGNSAKHVPRYSQQDMNSVESKMCAILQELSQTCIQLGRSEEEMKAVKHQLRSVKKHNSGESNEISQLRDTNSVLTSRVDRILHELASEQVIHIMSLHVSVVGRHLLHREDVMSSYDWLFLHLCTGESGCMDGKSQNRRGRGTECLGKGTNQSAHCTLWSNFLLKIS